MILDVPFASQRRRCQAVDFQIFTGDLVGLVGLIFHGVEPSALKVYTATALPQTQSALSH